MSKVENQAELSLGQSGLYIKAISYLLPNYGSCTMVLELPRKSKVDNLYRWGRNTAKRKPVADDESSRHFE